ncbi:unnamed protein product [Cladocopium goreaui]|uniref:Uncharacterized protein n=1 Tax=Cladocopium goreaui TaxID=2562237 RepID=A0A9P1DRM2_9DINO|nr:unnamed protein product [Cladocopium goreaui]
MARICRRRKAPAVLCICAFLWSLSHIDAQDLECFNFAGSFSKSSSEAVRQRQRPWPRVVRQIQTYDAYENMGNPFDVYAVAFGLSALMFVILFVVPFATNFGRTEEKEEEDVELLYEEVDDEDDEDDKEDLYEDESEKQGEEKKETKIEGKEVGAKKQETTASKA